MLQDSEGGLRRLMQDEIASGRYSDLSVLASLADGVSALIDQAGGKNGKEIQGRVSMPRAAKAAKAPQKPRASSKGSTKSAKYPYFEIGDDWIGKVGWSKKNREEYRHYAPISAAVALAEHVDKAQAPGRVWSVEDLGDVIDPDAGEALPSYQLYLVIAWMRSADLLVKQGRGGYVAVGGGALSPGVEKALDAG